MSRWPALLALTALGCVSSLPESIEDASSRHRRVMGRPACLGEISIEQVQPSEGRRRSTLARPPVTDEDLHRLAARGQLYTTRCTGDSGCYVLLISCVDGPSSCGAIADSWDEVPTCDPLLY